MNKQNNLALSYCFTSKTEITLYEKFSSYYVIVKKDNIIIHEIKLPNHEKAYKRYKALFLHYMY